MLMADALGHPELALDPRFLSNDLRCINRPALVTGIEAATRLEPIAHWIDRLNAAGIPCAPINTIDQLFEHPQLLARKMIVQVRGRSGRPVRTAGNPIKLGDFRQSESCGPIQAPALDEHREQLLAELMAPTGEYAPGVAEALS
jgi:CoA:oxalate CoA-transferase